MSSPTTWPSTDDWIINAIGRGVLLGACYGAGTFLWAKVVDHDSAAIGFVALAAFVGLLVGMVLSPLVGFGVAVVGHLPGAERVHPNLGAVAVVVIVGLIGTIATALGADDLNQGLYWFGGPAALGVVSLVAFPVRRTPATDDLSGRR